MSDDILCNWCGESCSIGPENHPYEPKLPHGLLETSVHGHYNSTPGNGYGALDDTMAYRFSLCEFCLDALFSRFKIPPTISEYLLMTGNPEFEIDEPFRPAEQRVREDNWRQSKDRFLAEKERRDKLRG